MQNKYKYFLGFIVICVLYKLLFGSADDNGKQNQQTSQTKSVITTDAGASSRGEQGDRNSNEKQKYRQSLIDIPVPDDIKGMEDYLRKYIPIKENVYVIVSESNNSPGYYIIDINVDRVNLSGTQCWEIACDVLSASYKATYEKGFPLIYASIEVTGKNDESLFLASIGKKIADRIDKGKWLNFSMNANEFKKFILDNQSSVVSAKADKKYWENRCIIQSNFAKK